MSSSVVRAMHILELLAGSEKPLGLSRIALELEIPKSTAHKILRDLVGEGFVETVASGAYEIGLRAFEVGSARLRTMGTVGVVAPELTRLTRTLNITSHYAVLDGGDVVYLCKEDPPGLGVRLASSVGARLPAHLTAVGKASLAWLEDHDVDAHLGAAQDGVLSARRVKHFKGELRGVRELGYAVDSGEAAAGILCVAAPVFDLSGCRGAIGTSHLIGAHHSVDSVAAKVVGTAQRVTLLLGGTPWLDTRTETDRRGSA
jgi:DNA-binding IclR family transcriptional regulator